MLLYNIHIIEYFTIINHQQFAKYSLANAQFLKWVHVMCGQNFNIQKKKVYCEEGTMLTLFLQPLRTALWRCLLTFACCLPKTQFFTAGANILISPVVLVERCKREVSRPQLTTLFYFF